MPIDLVSPQGFDPVPVPAPANLRNLRPADRPHRRRRALRVELIEPIEPRLLLSGTPIQSGQTIAGNLAAAGQIDSYTISASVGDTIQATLANANASSGLHPEIRLVAPNGDVVADVASGGTNTSVSTGRYPVPAGGAGPYTIMALAATGVSASTGAYNVEVVVAPAAQAADPDGDGGAIASGQTRSGSVNRLGNMDVYTFSATAGDTIQATLADAAAGLRPQLQLFSPDGTLITEQVSGGTNTSVSTGLQTAPAGGTGVYTLVVQGATGNTASTGAYNLELVRVPATQAADPDGDGGAIASGQTRAASIQRLGNIDVYTFSASAGDTFQATLADADANSGLHPQLQLFSPTGALLTSPTSGGTNTSVSTDPQTVSSGGAGVYTLVVQAATGVAPSTGAYNLELLRVPGSQAADPDGDGGFLASGQTRSGSVQRLGNMDVYTFVASSGDTIQATLGDADANSGLHPQLQLFSPAGAPVVTEASGGTNISVSTALYPVPAGGSGVYSLVVQATTGGAASTGAYNVEMVRVPAVQTASPDGDGGAIAVGQARTGSIQRLGNMDVYTFSASVGDSFHATLADAGAGLHPQLQLFSPTGDLIEVESSAGNNTSVSTADYPVPAGGAGVYSLVVQDTLGSVSPSLSPYNLTLAGTVTPSPGPTVIGRVGASDSATLFSDQSQRSQVRNLILTFGQPVTLAAHPFTLQRLNTGGSGANNNSPPTDASAALGTPAAVPGSNNTQWAVPLLASTAFTDATAGLADGIYQVVVAAGQVTSTATGAHPAADFTTPAFHRLFGDTDGNKTVNALDYARFKSVFGSSAAGAGYNADFDYDNNGTVNALDYAQFKLRFGKTFNY